ncbi:MAG: antibiotic biosynthesis monooxygenase [Chloroflexota bacterium]
MYIVCNRIGVNPGYEEAFEARFAQRDAAVDGMPGFIAFNLLRPQTDGDPYVVMTFWQDEASFKGWVESDEFKNQHAKSGQLPREAFTAHPKLEYFDVIQSTLKLAADEA